MKISIIGCGYVGIVTGVCLADNGHKIFFFDKNKERINNLRSGKNLIFEKNLKKKINSVKRKNNIFFCNNLDDTIRKSDAAFICVGTPLKKNNIDLQYIKHVTSRISEKLKLKKIIQ